MNQYNIRTDLALESKEFIEEANGEIRGIQVQKISNKELDVQITKVDITSPNGAKIMKKPIGSYITIEANHLLETETDYQNSIISVISDQLKNILPPLNSHTSILVVGLGNRDVTADALGPSVINHLQVTRHILNDFGNAAYPNQSPLCISAIAPDVMGKTGMETAEIISGIISVTHPNVVIAIDALAARNTKRLNRTIQLTNTGIHPGSGIGNHTTGLTIERLGIPVIALGIPTVIDATTIISDAFSKQGILTLNETVGDLRNMYVTSKDIDAIISHLSQLIAKSLNQCFQS